MRTMAAMNCANNPMNFTNQLAQKKDEDYMRKWQRQWGATGLQVSRSEVLVCGQGLDRDARWDGGGR